VFWGLASLSCVRRFCHRPAAYLVDSCLAFPCSTVCLYTMEVFFYFFYFFDAGTVCLYTYGGITHAL
jgi:hypothetical protein